MTIARSSPTRRRVAMFAGLAVVVTIALFGAAQMIPRGVDPALLPTMAEHPVVMPDGAKLFVQKFEITVDEWNACHADGACSISLRAPAGKSGQTTPATGLSFVDAGQYITWINRTTHHHFRLPTLTEWEHMAAEVLPEEPDPIFTSPELTWASTYLTAPATKRTLRTQGSFSTTSHGIVDLDGSVWEWTSECYAGTSEGNVSPDRCPAFFVGGEHIAAMSFLERDPARGGCAVGAPPAHLGMRLVSDKKP